MSTLLSLRELYNREREKYLQLEEEARYCLNKWLGEANIKVHTVTSRTKTLNSYEKKIIKFEENGKDPSQIFDVVGTRIVCLFLADIARVEKLIHEKFEIVSSDNKIRNQEDDVFGYMSDHYLVKLKSIYSGPRYDDIKPLIFEIQVRTMAMDAWASLSHYLNYKSDVEVPKELKKSFHALSGLFYVADKTFEHIFEKQKNVKSNRSAVSNVDEAESDELTFNLMKEHIRRRFPKRKESTDYGEFFSEIKAAKIYKTSEFEKLLERAEDIELDLEKRSHLSILSGKAFYYTDVGAARALLREICPEYLAVYNAKLASRLESKRSLKKK